MPDEMSDFDKLWYKAQREPVEKEFFIRKELDLDLSITHVLKRYKLFAEKSYGENRINKSVYQNLSTQIDKFKETIAEIDKDSILDSVSDFGSRLFSHFKRRD